jgi:hypothetical protein
VRPRVRIYNPYNPRYLYLKIFFGIALFTFH